MHGNGNDVVVVLADTGAVPPDVAAIRAMGHRRTGIGFDQLIWVTKSTATNVAADYLVFNADGSEVEQCGNGARCAARAWFDTQNSTSPLVLASAAGPIVASIDGESVTLDMGPPREPGAALPGAAASPEHTQTIAALGSDWTFWLVSMGNPHAVTLVADCATAPVAALGELLQTHGAFPEGVNVGFLAPSSRSHGQLRVYERGVGETLACGSGASAAHVAGVRAGVFDNDSTLTLPGGDLMVSWRGNGDSVRLTGPASYVYHGTIDL